MGEVNLLSAHSWFDSNEVQPVRVKQSKYEDHEDEGAMGATLTFMVDLCITSHII